MSPDDDTEVYEPEPVAIADGEFVIFDLVEFEREFNCYGVMVRDGGVFVLCKETRKLVTAEGRGVETTKPAGRLKGV